MDWTPHGATLFAMLLAAPCGIAGEPCPPCPEINPAATASFDPKPYLDDLQEARAAFSTNYAGLEWEVFVRDHDISATFATARAALTRAHGEWDARKAFERLTHSFGDKHVRIRWPEAPSPGSEPPAKAFSCAALGYDAGMLAAPLAALLPGYTPVRFPADNVFPTGIVVRERRTIGIIKIPIFTAHGFPGFCESAVDALHIDRSKECNSDCDEAIRLRGERLMTQQLEAAIKAVEQAGAGTLIVDVAGNGGGSEWEGAASRVLTPIRLEAIPNYFARGALWTKHFSTLERDLQAAAAKADEEDQTLLTHLIEQVNERLKVAETPCDATPLWEGKHTSCTFLGDAFFTTGLLSSADPKSLRAKPWASLVFNPMKYPYHEGVWRGPLIVVVDGGTGSAAENFAAELQDNHAAVIVGSPTVGAGGGHTDGGSPTTLPHTGAILDLSDCARVRRNGLNLSSGVQPDVLVGFRDDDSPRRRASILEQKLDEALRARP